MLPATHVYEKTYKGKWTRLLNVFFCGCMEISNGKVMYCIHWGSIQQANPIINGGREIGNRALPTTV